MLQRKTVNTVVCVLFSMIGLSQSVFASDVTWNAVTGDNDLNTAGNWIPIGVPGFSQDAIFDSTVSGINISPSATADFGVDSFNFPNSAKKIQRL